MGKFFVVFISVFRSFENAQVYWCTGVYELVVVEGFSDSKNKKFYFDKLKTMPVVIDIFVNKKELSLHTFMYVCVYTDVKIAKNHVRMMMITFEYSNVRIFEHF